MVGFGIGFGILIEVRNFDGYLVYPGNFLCLFSLNDDHRFAVFPCKAGIVRLILLLLVWKYPPRLLFVFLLPSMWTLISVHDPQYLFA